MTNKIIHLKKTNVYKLIYNNNYKNEINLKSVNK